MTPLMPMEWMAPLMFGGLVVFMLVGYPVAFSLAALGLVSGFASIELGYFEPIYMSNLPLRVFGILSNDLLLSIPFFTFMGAILERCGLAEDLLEGTGQLFGAVPGGLAYLCMDWRHAKHVLVGCEETGLELLNMIVWDKVHGGMGSFYRSRHELIFLARKPGAQVIGHAACGRSVGIE
jgi:hypothetical protein